MPSPAVAVVLTLIVRMYGDRLVEPDVLQRAQSTAQAIFERSAIAIEWLRCADTPTLGDCSAAARSNEVVARLLAGPPSVSDDSCGVALVPRRGAGHFVSVFVGCVRGAADRLRVATHVLLGSVLAHEIGHVLLGTNSHGSIGLMQAQPRPIDWERAARGGLTFTPQEIVRLRASLAQRIVTRAAGVATR